MTPEDAAPAKPPLARATVAVICACLALGVVSALETRHVSATHGLPIPWAVVLTSTMPRWLVLALTLPLALNVATRPSLRSLRAGVIVLHAALFLATSGAYALVTLWMLDYRVPIALAFPWSARFLRAWYAGLPLVVAAYGAVLAAAWALNEMRERQQRAARTLQLEAQLERARLTALRARLQPHFLYNTLHGIAALVGDMRPAQALAAIDELSELLHAALQDDARDVVSLSEEIRLAERYLTLQQMRFGERLRFELDLPPALASFPVPVLVLQPIVENAVVHGLEAGRQHLLVRIAAARMESGVEVRVENDGPSPEPNGGRRAGVGLAATAARLATMFGERASLRLDERPGGGVIVRILLPASLTAAHTT